VAYSSNESGRFEVHVQTFPLTDRQWTVSTTGGYEPRWRADGREMYYLSADQKLMAVGVGPGPSFGAPTKLFQVRVAGDVSALRTHYVPAATGGDSSSAWHVLGDPERRRQYDAALAADVKSRAQEPDRQNKAGAAPTREEPSRAPDSSERTPWECSGCGRQVPHYVDKCRCGQTRTRRAAAPTTDSQSGSGKKEDPWDLRLRVAAAVGVVVFNLWNYLPSLVHSTPSANNAPANWTAYHVPSATARTGASSNRTVLPTLLQSEGAGCDFPHRVVAVTADGEFVRLEDGSLWEIQVPDRVNTRRWRETETVFVCKGNLRSSLQ